MSVKEIFESMEYGPAPESAADAFAWLVDQGDRFGPFIDGAFREAGETFKSRNPANGETLAEIRMTGAKFLSRKSAHSKARTAASIRALTSDIPEAVRLPIAAATGGAVTGLGGGVPIRLDGQVVGGIGVGSGSAEQDIAVARAALAAIGADLFD